MNKSILFLLAMVTCLSLQANEPKVLKLFGVAIRGDVFLAHPVKVEGLAIDLWADTDWEWKADPDKVNIWKMGANRIGTVWYMQVVTLQQVKGRVKERSNYWAQVLSYPGVKWATGYDIYGDSGLTIVGVWKNGVVE